MKTRVHYDGDTNVLREKAITHLDNQISTSASVWDLLYLIVYYGLTKMKKLFTPE